MKVPGGGTGGGLLSKEIQQEEEKEAGAPALTSTSCRQMLGSQVASDAAVELLCTIKCQYTNLKKLMYVDMKYFWNKKCSSINLKIIIH